MLPCYSSHKPFVSDKRFQKKHEGKFSEEEQRQLTNILIITRSKFESFVRLQNFQRASKIKGDMLASMHIGYITVNSDFQVIDCNSYGIECVLKIWSVDSVNAALKHLRLFIEGLPTGERETVVKEFIITPHSYSEIDFYGRLHQYYSFTIKRKGSFRGKAGTNNDILPFDTLSPREMEILDAFCHGYEYEEICEKLFISIDTAHTHMKNIYKKLNISNQRKLVYEYLKRTL